MQQQSQAEDFVIATGEQHSVRDFVARAAAERRTPTPWYLRPARWLFRRLTATWACQVCGWEGFRFRLAA